jgi:NAD(P)-dependent dehydrogenase (short-subunit alcohol dehydrogenase family)
MDRTALITGGTGALGTAVTQQFLDEGYRVVSTWVVKEEAETMRKQLGDRDGRLTLLECDVTDADDVTRTVTDIERDVGPVDALVHLVGAWRGGTPVHEHKPEAWDLMMKLNLKSAFLCSRAVLPGMLERDHGRIIFVSSRTAKTGRSGQAAYAVAKAGVAVLAETIAEETRGTGVTANTVAPSTIDTPANRKMISGGDPAKWVTPADLAASIVYLASEPAGQLRGAWLPVYGSA